MATSVATLKTAELKGFEVDAGDLGKVEKEMVKRLGKKGIKAKVTAEVVAGGKAVKFTIDPVTPPDVVKACGKGQ